MIMPSDRDYKVTKLIKQGFKSISPDFLELSNWINKTYDVSVLNILYDTINNSEIPRLTIVFEFNKDELKFREGLWGNYDIQKQQLIAEKFEKLVKQKTTGLNVFNKLFYTSNKEKYATKNLYVIFTSFEPIAKDEANSSIPEIEIEKFKRELELKELWKIYRQFSGTTFFFYTDEQIAENSNNGLKDCLTEKYFHLLKRFDQFDYFKRETFSIMLDSKENFDSNYQGSWFYYSR